MSQNPDVYRLSRPLGHVDGLQNEYDSAYHYHHQAKDYLKQLHVETMSTYVPYLRCVGESFRIWVKQAQAVTFREPSELLRPTKLPTPAAKLRLPNCSHSSVGLKVFLGITASVGVKGC